MKKKMYWKYCSLLGFDKVLLFAKVFINAQKKTNRLIEMKFYVYLETF